MFEINPEALRAAIRLRWLCGRVISVPMSGTLLTTTSKGEKANAGKIAKAGIYHKDPVIPEAGSCSSSHFFWKPAG